MTNIRKLTSAIFGSTALCLLAAPAFADQVILDDLIVDGSLCVGFDCVNGESFGSDTLRLKENNLRIHMQDTSASASFPTRDWRIIFNDSSNGGANYFAVEDGTTFRKPFRVEANAPAHALYVDDGGRVGLGTASPVVELHAVDGDTPTLRLEQDGSSGFGAQTWDLAGNETNFFVRDVTNGSVLPFRIRPSAPSSSIDINGDGDVGFGTSSPDTPLHVRRSTGGLADMLTLENEGDVAIILENNSGDANSTSEWKVANFQSNFFVGTPANPGPEMTLSPTGDMTVTGNYFTTGGGQLNVPDYVFADDYKLMPLAEVQAFIDENSHLPNIPSAKQIGETGLNMTQMQMALLEKVEELTLYTLDQEKKIAALEAELATFAD